MLFDTQSVVYNGRSRTCVAPDSTVNEFTVVNSAKIGGIANTVDCRGASNVKGFHYRRVYSSITWFIVSFIFRGVSILPGIALQIRVLFDHYEINFATTCSIIILQAGLFCCSWALMTKGLQSYSQKLIDIRLIHSHSSHDVQ